jgi:hypothetical protein
MTDSEAERLTAVAEQDGMTLGEWCREVLLERADGRKPSVIEETLLSEVLALRTILLNLHFTYRSQRKPMPLAEPHRQECLCHWCWRGRSAVADLKIGHYEMRTRRAAQAVTD